MGFYSDSNESAAVLKKGVSIGMEHLLLLSLGPEEKHTGHQRWDV